MAAKRSQVYQYINFGISFGLTMVITLYLLYQAGHWLDNRLGTYPLCTFIGVLLAVATVFKRLITDLGHMDKQKDDK